ncbi:FAD-dependent oxidoreductase, partial [Acidocella aminolytica]|uniref:Hydroxyglutarate oxidase n=1 Tax=Acidocella aminolytica 101 = DSM 11237 TaxID=1120923 RepID=A0A0D6PK88_9PROT
MQDVCIIGGGIVGLATANALLTKRPGISITVLEQEQQPGLHQTGHNSGVIHSGIYYAPGSLKARLCREGAAATEAFCAENDIPVEVCGKHLVATNALEASRMEALAQRADENNIAYERIDATELRSREPAIAGVGALFIPSTGIVDYQLICQVLARKITQSGGQVVYGARVDRIEETASQIVVHAAGQAYQARWLVACAG